MLVLLYHRIVNIIIIYAYLYYIIIIISVTRSHTTKSRYENNIGVAVALTQLAMKNMHVQGYNGDSCARGNLRETAKARQGRSAKVRCPHTRTSASHTTSYFDRCNGHSSGTCAGPDLVDGGSGCTWWWWRDVAVLVGCGGGDCAQTPLACVAVFM